MNATERRIQTAAVRLFAERGTTDLSISDLASEAGVARGTLYRNIGSIGELFDQVLDNLASDLHEGNLEVMDKAGITDPPRRLATGIRLLVRLAHQEPSLGRFLVRFGITNESMRAVLAGPPMQDLERGITTGRYDVELGREASVTSLLMGTTVSAIWMVLEGHQGWREAGSEAARLVLRALGVDAGEAASIAVEPLPAST